MRGDHTRRTEAAIGYASPRTRLARRDSSWQLRCLTLKQRSIDGG